MQKFLEKKLKILTKAALRIQRPKIITITGSVGKTSTKEAVFAVLEKKFNVRRSLKNFNNEIGVPLTVVGCDSPGKSVAGWVEVFFKFVGLSLWRLKRYPDVLVLEIGSDKPGDLKYLMDMIPRRLLKAAVLTAVSASHLEFFGDIDGVFKEKTAPFGYLRDNAFAILNKDNCDFEKVRQKLQKKFITYAIKQPAEVTAADLKATKEGITFVIKYHGNSSEFLLADAVSPHQVYALLAGVSVGISLGMSFADIISGLKNYSILPGRMRKIKGINNSLIIDDTYNSSPIAAVMALQALSKLPLGKRRIAVLGDMLEMGEQSEKLHRHIGEIAAKSNIDYLFAFGPESKFTAEAAIKSGMHKSTVHHFSGQLKLTEYLEKMLKPDDVILIKASQGMRLEKVVKSLMEYPKRAPKLLVRQNKEWLKK